MCIRDSNNGRGYKHIYFTIDETVHDALKLRLLHLSVRKCNSRIRHQRLQLCCYVCYVAHLIVHIVHLLSLIHI